jgi:flagellar hook protein FlgE
MIQAMYNGVSGLRAHKTQMDVISNNIANINTIGFKTSSVTFREMISQTLRGAGAPKPGGLGGTNPMQIGLGVGIGSIETNMTSGSLLPTGKTTDVAIEGSGFLILGDGQGKYYTRDGSFNLDAEGNIVSAGSGLRVLGWTADLATGGIDDAAPISASSGIRLPVGQLAIARQTSNIALGGNLNSDSAVGGKANASLEVFDSLGVSHTLTVTFTKTANDSEWDWEVTSPDAAVGSTIGTGTITFTSGKSDITTEGISFTMANSNGATNPVDITLDFKAITQYGADSTAANGGNTVAPTSQDGLPLGVLDGFTVDKDGTINGTFDNGMTQRMGRIALAQFGNPGGLSRTGNNLWAETGNSGLPQVGAPATGSLGNLTAGFLESSNVDLPTEFANMIVAQRGFQANSRVITTSDEILQELVQLKR